MFPSVRKKTWTSTFLLILLYASLLAVLEASDSLQDNFQEKHFWTIFGSSNILLVTLTSLAIFLLVVIILIPMCMNCGDPEVSSMTHPACQGVQTQTTAPTNELLPLNPGPRPNVGFAGYPEPPPPYEESRGNIYRY